MYKKMARVGPVPRLLLVAVTAFVAVLALTAAVRKHNPGMETDAAAWTMLDKNNFWCKLWNYQYVGDTTNETGEYPGGSGIMYVYTSNIWFGCMKSGAIYVIANMPGSGSAFEWNPIPPTDTAILRSDSSNWGQRPTKVTALGDLDTYAIADDSTATENGSIPTVLEVHGICWSAPGHDDWVVLECWLQNKNTAPIDNCYVSLQADYDVGGSNRNYDDLVGYEGNDNYDLYVNPMVAGVPWTEGSGGDGIPDENDVVNFYGVNNKNQSNNKPLHWGESTVGRGRELAYIYDDGGEARICPGYVGIRVMGWMDEPAEDNLITLSSQHSWDIMNDPDSDDYKYGYMIDAGTFDEVNTAYDWRIDPTWGPFEMEADETLHFWKGIVIGPDLNGLRKNADQLYADFLGPDGLPNTADDWTVVAPPGSPRLVAVRGDNLVTLRWNPRYDVGKNTETEKDPRTDVVDFDGYVVWRSDIGFDSGWEPILWIDKLSNNPAMNKPWGWRTGERIPSHNPAIDANEPDLTDAPAVTYENVKNSWPAPLRGGGEVRVRKTGGYYELVDGVDGDGAVNGVINNGTRYYYAVTPYDFGNLTGLEATPAMGGRNSNGVSVIPLANKRTSLDAVKVVPNPYKGSADWEEWTGSGARLGRVYFMGLPARCTIRIYTVAGDLVRTLEHSDVEYGAEPWDLTGDSHVQVASGIYFYHIDAPGIGEKIGKFAVLIGQN